MNEVLIAFIGALGGVLTALLPVLVKYKSNKLVKDGIDKDLLNHSFFVQMIAWKNAIPIRLQIENPLKKACVYKFMKIKFLKFHETFKKITEDFITNKNEVVLDKLRETFLETIEDYEKEARLEGIPEIFIQKFGDWHQKHIDLTFHSLNDTLNRNIYSDKREVFNAILDIMLFAFRMTFVDAVMSINSLNGELEKVLKKKYLKGEFVIHNNNITHEVEEFIKKSIEDKKREVLENE